jgi:ribose transport system permease protein
LIALVGFFSIGLPDLFPTYPNLIGIVGNETIAAIVALGLLVPLAAGVFDISIAGMMTLSIIIITSLFQSTNGAMPIPIAILLTLVAGIAVGSANGFLVVKARVDPFIATIGTGSVLVGISEMITNGTTVTFSIPSAFTDIGRTKIVFGMPITIIYVILLAALIAYVLGYTPFGRMIYATGAGRDAARLSGIRTDRVIFLSFVVSAVCATLAGIVFSARIGSGPPDIGSNYLLPAFASTFLGSTMINPGRFNVGGLIIAMLIVAVGINGLQLYGIPFWVVATFQGCALIAAVVLSKLRAVRG